MDLKELTIVVPSKNEEKNIGAFLKSIPDEIKLIVVDSSTDETRALIQSIRPQNTTIYFEECNIPRARQIGLEQADTNWILYSDCDMTFDENYFSHLQRMPVSASLGEIMGGKHSRKKYRCYYRFYSFNMMWLSWFTIPVGSGSNMILRKEALLQIGGFDLALSHSEDSDILWRIRKAGWRIVFNRNLKVYESDHRRLDRGVFKKMWHGSLRAFFLMTGINKKSVRQSDWGYWDTSIKK